MSPLLLGVILLSIGYLGWRYGRRGHQFAGGTSLFYGGIFLMLAILLASDSLYQYWRNGPIEQVDEAYIARNTNRLDMLLKKVPEPRRRAWFNQRIAPAILENKLEDVRYLIDRGARVDEKSWDGTGWFFVAFHASEPQVSEEILCLLAEHLEDPNMRGPAQETPLELAVGKHDPALIHILLQHGANPELPDFRGVSPLSLARSSYPEIVPELLSHSSRP